MTGAELIALERERQITEEEWDAGHDDEHDEDQLAVAAVAYTLPHYRRQTVHHTGVPRIWPFQSNWWKPTPDDRVRELVKAGALIAAEIDRLQRQDID